MGNKLSFNCSYTHQTSATLRNNFEYIDPMGPVSISQNIAPRGAAKTILLVQ